MARILAISSQVARGHIGLSAVVPALQALGHEVIALPTILLSNRPGYAHVVSERISPDFIARQLDALGANGWLNNIDSVLTGYMPSVGHVALISEAVQQLKQLNPDLCVVCDPVLGDEEPKGRYIPEDAAVAIRDLLLPVADVIKLNRFELAWLSGAAPADAATASRIVETRGWRRLAVTSLPTANADEIENALIIDGQPVACIRVPRISGIPHGTGDLFGAMLVGLLGRAALTAGQLEAAFRVTVDGVRLVVERSRDANELRLVESLGDLSNLKTNA